MNDDKAWDAMASREQVRNTGGPAFPVSGMTLRDYFAAKAMLGFIAEPVEGIKEPLYFNLSTRTCADMASASYALADAMLLARVAR